MTQTTNSNVNFNGQADPMLHLLINSTATQNMELTIQSSASQVLQSWSQGATDSISAGDADLTTRANKMSSSSLPSSTVTQLNTEYNTAQTKYSNLNNQYSTEMQAGGTIVTNLTQVQQQTLQLCQVTVDFMNNLNQLIMNVA